MLVITLLVTLLCVQDSAGQTLDDLLILPQTNDASFIGLEDSIYRLDLRSGELNRHAPFPDRSLFAPNTLPQHNSSVASGKELWLWDSSIGSVVHIESLGQSTVFPREAGPTYSRFNHISTLHPISRLPLVFGGYGFYRAKNFFIFFDSDLGEWHEAPAISGQHDPPPRDRGRLLDAGNARDIFLLGGFTSLTEHDPHYDNADSRRAWTFDVQSGSWDRLRINEAVTCAMLDQPVWRIPAAEEADQFVSVFSQ